MATTKTPPKNYTTNSSGQFVPISTTGSGGLNDPNKGLPSITPGGTSNVGANNALANNMVNQANAQYGSVTSELRRANEANRARIDSETEGQIQGARDFEFASQNFARAQLGKIGGFEGTYGIGLQNSIAARTEKNIQGIKRAGEEAKAAGDYNLHGKLAELGLQQMTLLAQLNSQAFEQSKFATELRYKKERDIISDEQFKATEARLGKDFTQLDNGDYGYFDINTNKFVKLGNAAKPASGGGSSDTIFGKKVKERAPLYDRKTQDYLGDEIVFQDGSKTFVDPTGTEILTGRGQQLTGGMSVEGVGEVAPTYAEGTIDLSKTRRGNPIEIDDSKTGVQINSDINRAIAADPGSWAAMTNQQKANFIRSKGGMPTDFGIYD